ncbi:hypothetical protein SARC_16747, partial [Sphaeroforma arctica JP610]
MLSRFTTKVDLWMDPWRYIVARRGPLHSNEYMANKKQFNIADKAWGPHTHDGFALLGNNHLP